MRVPPGVTVTCQRLREGDRLSPTATGKVWNQTRSGVFEGCDDSVATFMLTRGLRAMLLIASIVLKAKVLSEKAKRCSRSISNSLVNTLNTLNVVIPSLVSVFASVLAQSNRKLKDPTGLRR